MDWPPTPDSREARKGKVRARPLYMERVDAVTVAVHGKLGWRGTEAEWEARRAARRTEPSLLLSNSLGIASPPSGRHASRQLSLSSSSSSRSEPSPSASRRPDGGGLLGGQGKKKAGLSAYALALRRISRLVCCPPCPASIYRKLVFAAPETASYTFLAPDPDGRLVHLTRANRADWPLSTVFKVQYRCGLPPEAGDGLGLKRWRDKSGAEALTELEGRLVGGPGREDRLACVHLPLGAHLAGQRSESAEPPALVLFLHGNASDLGVSIPFMYKLRRKLAVSVAALDYYGYGLSSGRPGGDGQPGQGTLEVLHFLRQEFRLPLQQIFLLGFSLGTGLTTRLAALYPELGGVVLAGALVSPMAVVRPLRHCFFPGPRSGELRSWDWAPRIQSRTLVVHGRRDRIVPMEHSRWLAARLRRPAPPLYVPLAGHNDLLDKPQTMLGLLDFLEWAGLPAPYPALRRRLTAYLLQKSRSGLHRACLERAQSGRGPAACQACAHGLVRLFFAEPGKFGSIRLEEDVFAEEETLRVALSVEPTARPASLWDARFALLITNPQRATPN